MTQELPFGLEVQSQRCSSLGGSWVQPQNGLAHCNGGSDSDDISKGKRLKLSSLKVYSRRGKLSNGVAEEPKSEQKPCSVREQEIFVANGVNKEQADGISSKYAYEEELHVDQDALVDVVVEFDFSGIRKRPRLSAVRRIGSDEELVDVVIRDDNRGLLGSFIRKEGRVNLENVTGSRVYRGQVNGLSNCSLLDVKQRRLPKSLFKPDIQVQERDRETVSAVSELDDVASQAIFDVGMEAATGANARSTQNNMKLKMSKKIAFNKKLMTVKDLFDTGLLDGVTVVYMGGFTKASGLTGTIMEGGILCSCSLCNGLRVLPPSQFEIHACKVYRRAAQYICLENGTSLLDVLKTCRCAPANMLEATIQRIISAQPVEKTFTCRGCKNVFPSSFVARIGPLCNTCVELRKSQSPSTASTGKITRSEKAAIALETSAGSEISLDGSSEPRVKLRSVNKQLISISPEMYSVYSKRKRSKSIKLSESILASKSSASTSACTPKRKKGRLKTITKSSKSVTNINFLRVPSASAPAQNKQFQLTVKDQRLHKLVFEEDGLPDGTEVAYYSRGQKILEGYKKGFGIFCRCCNCEVSPSQFEAHAGWSSRKKPYSNIYISNGVSLHELAISLSRGRRFSIKDKNTLCTICADSGNLLLCDGCPRAFHRECASLTNVPHGSWYCHYCQNLLQEDNFVNENAIAAGRVSGVDPIEQITSRCIRIVKEIGAEVSGCVLCGCHDFSKSGFGPRTIILCDQCEQEFHIGCLREHKMANLKELPKGKWFCCEGCNQIHSTLQNLLLRGPVKLTDSLLGSIKKKHEDEGADTSGCDVSWRLLSGSFATPESRKLLSEAVSIFHECFDPIVDWMTGRDLIPSMVYGRSTGGQEYGGIYCAVLIVSSVVVSAGIFRVFGKEIAELPLVATRKGSHDKGYFQSLFSCIERLLSSMKVKSLVLPAAAEAESIWTDKFGFTRLIPEELSRYRKLGCQMLTFQGTSMLKKPVSQFSNVSMELETLMLKKPVAEFSTINMESLDTLMLKKPVSEFCNINIESPDTLMLKKPVSEFSNINMESPDTLMLKKPVSEFSNINLESPDTLMLKKPVSEFINIDMESSDTLMLKEPVSDNINMESSNTLMLKEPVSEFSNINMESPDTLKLKKPVSEFSNINMESSVTLMLMEPVEAEKEPVSELSNINMEAENEPVSELSNINMEAEKEPVSELSDINMEAEKEPVSELSNINMEAEKEPVSELSNINTEAETSMLKKLVPECCTIEAES